MAVGVSCLGEAEEARPSAVISIPNSSPLTSVSLLSLLHLDPIPHPLVQMSATQASITPFLTLIDELRHKSEADSAAIEAPQSELKAVKADNAEQRKATEQLRQEMNALKASVGQHTQQIEKLDDSSLSHQEQLDPLLAEQRRKRGRSLTSTLTAAPAPVPEPEPKPANSILQAGASLPGPATSRSGRPLRKPRKAFPLGPSAQPPKKPRFLGGIVGPILASTSNFSFTNQALGSRVLLQTHLRP